MGSWFSNICNKYHNSVEIATQTTNISEKGAPDWVLLETLECVCCSETVDLDNVVRMTCKNCSPVTRMGIIAHRACAILLGRSQNRRLWPRCVICSTEEIDPDNLYIFSTRKYRSRQIQKFGLSPRLRSTYSLEEQPPLPMI